MRVQFVIGAYPPSTGGAQLHTRELARALCATGRVEPAITTLWRESRTDYLLGTTTRLRIGTRSTVDQGIRVDEVGLRHRRHRDIVMAYAYLPARRTASTYFARALEYSWPPSDLVHVVRLGREHLAVAAYRDARSRGLPVVLTPNHHPRWSGRRPDPVWRRLYREADAVVALTEVERRLLIDLGVAPERVVVTGIGPVLAAASDIAHLKLPQRYLLFLGQQHDYKRLDVALDAIAALGSAYDDVELVLAGPTAAATPNEVRRRGLQDRVRVLGTVDEPTKAALIGRAACLVFPSEQEAFGGVLIEAAAVGTPFVARAIPQLVEVSHALSWGRTFEGGGVALAAALRQVLGNSPTDDERATAACAVERYSWPALADTYLTLYEQLVKGARLP